MEPSPEKLKLTKKQSETLSLLAEGLQHSEMAERLGITKGGVEWRVSNLLSRLNTRSSLEAVLKGIKLGILDSQNLILKSEDNNIVTNIFAITEILGDEDWYMKLIDNKGEPRLGIPISGLLAFLEANPSYTRMFFEAMISAKKD